MNKIKFFFKNLIVKGKIKKKKLHNINNTEHSLKKVLTKVNLYKKYINYNNVNIVKIKNQTNSNLIINISQKMSNPKCIINKNKNLNSFSVGSVIKYFKVRQGKYVRRSSHGLKIFLNFLKNIFIKKYETNSGGFIIISLSGIDYNLVALKKNLKFFFKNKNAGGVYSLINLKVDFTKKKEKKIKSIKKRLKKKIISTFLKSTI